MNKNEYRIVIDINDEVGGGNGAVAGSKDKQPNIEKAVGRLVRYQVVQPFIETTKQIVMNEVDTKIGSTELSMRINTAMGLAQSAYQTGVYGLSLASALGVSGWIGIAVAGAITLFKKALDITKNTIEIQNKAKLENEQLSILRGRAGVQFNRSRSGEW